MSGKFTKSFDEVEKQIPGADQVFGPLARSVGPPRRKRGNELAVAADGTIQVGKFTLTVCGLVADEGVAFEEWEQLGKVLQRFEASIQWLIGDWMAYGERVWGQTYEQVATATGYKEKSLREFAYIARNIDLSIRMDTLTFGHHHLVASMDPEAQRQWLEYAASNNLSISQMRAAIEGQPPALPEGKDPVSKFQRVFIPFQQRLNRVLRKAGQGDRRKIADWLRKEADRIERGDT